TALQNLRQNHLPRPTRRRRCHHLRRTHNRPGQRRPPRLRRHLFHGTARRQLQSQRLSTPRRNKAHRRHSPRSRTQESKEHPQKILGPRNLRLHRRHRQRQTHLR